MPSRRAFRRLAVILGAALLSIPSFVAWETFRAVRHARATAVSASSLRVAIQPLDRPMPIDVDPIGTRATVRDAAVFAGHLFVGGPQGLVEYDASGAAVRRFRSGLELPPGAIVGVSVGVLAASPLPQLLVATANEGLLTFDGRRMLHVRPDRADLRKITALLPLSSGRVLLGTDAHGLLVFDGQRLTVAHPELADLAVTALAGTDGDVWIGTVDRGVWHWRAGGIDRFGEREGLPDRRVVSMATDGLRAYVGTAVGTAEFENGRFTRTLGDGLFANALAVRGDTLLAASVDDAIAAIPLAVRSSRGVRPFLHDVPGAVHRFITADGSLYALGDDAVYVVDDRTAALRRVLGAEAGALTDRNVSALAVDAAGRLWVGYFDRGLDVIDGQQTLHVETDRVFCVNRIVPGASNGLTAVATANGLVMLDAAGHPKQVLGRAQGLIADHVTDLVVNAGRMTVATPAGLTFLDRDGSRSMYAFHGLVNNHVYALGSSGSELLVGTLGGITMLDHGSVHATYTTANSALAHNWITAVARVDEDWFVGTYGGGMFRMDAKGEWHRFADLAAAIEINPNAIAVTDAHVFAGSLSRGLLVFDRVRERWTTFDAGLPSLNVTAIAVDRSTVYVGTDNGIVRVKERVFAP